MANISNHQQHSVISIAPAVCDALAQHMTSSPTTEVCGILLGTQTASVIHIHSYRRLRNVAPDPLHHFALDPQEWIDCCYREQELIGLFHSHPTTAPIPSEIDLRQLPEFAAMISVYLIGTTLLTQSSNNIYSHLPNSAIDSSNHTECPYRCTDPSQDEQPHPYTITIGAYKVKKQYDPSDTHHPIYHLQPAQLNRNEHS